MRGHVISLSAAALLLAATAQAGSIGVGPTRIELDARTQVQTLTVQNTGDSPSLLQVDVHHWEQAEDGDRLSPATELVASPRVFELKPGETRSVRVGLRASRPTTSENAFRVYVREVQPVAAGDGAQLRYLMQVGIPVFVGPSSGGAAASVSWALDATESGCNRLRLTNDGSRRERVLALDYRERGRTVWRHDVPHYLLAGTSRALAGAPCVHSTPDAQGELLFQIESGEQRSARFAPGN